MTNKGKSIHDKSYVIMISMLKALRERLQIKQSELAEKMGVDQTVISKIENRERRLDLLELRKMCRAMDYSLIDFITELEAVISIEEKNGRKTIK